MTHVKDFLFMCLGQPIKCPLQPQALFNLPSAQHLSLGHLYKSGALNAAGEKEQRARPTMCRALDLERPTYHPKCK